MRLHDVTPYNTSPCPFKRQTLNKSADSRYSHVIRSNIAKFKRVPMQKERNKISVHLRITTTTECSSYSRKWNAFHLIQRDRRDQGAALSHRHHNKSSSSLARPRYQSWMGKYDWISSLLRSWRAHTQPT